MAINLARRVILSVAGVSLAAILLSPAIAQAACQGPAAPDVAAKQWLNSPPLKIEGLRGKVVLVEFWTLGCSNCRAVQPHIKDWHARYAELGLVVVGVHTPEFNYEKDLGTVRQYVTDQDIRYPVAIDNDFAIWNRYGNRYWPALYLVDKQGRVCYSHIGEGNYGATEQAIRTLLAE